MLKLGNSTVFTGVVRYVRIPTVCHNCGRVGHLQSTCFYNSQVVETMDVHIMNGSMWIRTYRAFFGCRISAHCFNRRQQRQVPVAYYLFLWAQVLLWVKILSFSVELASMACKSLKRMIRTAQITYSPIKASWQQSPT